MSYEDLISKIDKAILQIKDSINESKKEKIKLYTSEYWNRPEVKKRKAEQNFIKYQNDSNFRKNSKASFKKYYESNKEKFIEEQLKRNKKNEVERREYARKYYLRNKEKLKNRQKKYYRENTEQYKEYKKNDSN
ncbi:hypothetical protein OAH75_01045 [Nitrosopumilus sp.]|nr:hypothetical protein [Nitrosopumilus sp.]MDB4839890.1 hypothetical protein [Nitrosopumilus sp.]